MADEQRPEADDESTLRRLESRLSRATEAAERLISEAARGASANPPPPAGWQAPPADGGASRREQDLEILLGLVQRLRDLVPPELQQRLAEALRELLLAIRAVIDWYLDRLERRRREPAEVTDIPIL